MVGWLGRVPGGGGGAGRREVGCGRPAGAGGGVRVWVLGVGWVGWVALLTARPQLNELFKHHFAVGRVPLGAASGWGGRDGGEREGGRVLFGGGFRGAGVGGAVLCRAGWWVCVGVRAVWVLSCPGVGWSGSGVAWGGVLGSCRVRVCVASVSVSGVCVD